MSSAAPKMPEAPDEDIPFSRDPALDWFHAHLADLQPYKGKRVAIDPVRGVIAVGDTDRDVCERLDALGEPRESDVVIFVVR